MNYKTVKRVRDNLSHVIENFGDKPFRAADIRNQKVFPLGVGTVDRYLKRFIHNGCLIFDETSTQSRKVYRIEKALNFDSSPELSEKRPNNRVFIDSITTKIISSAPTGFFTKKDVLVKLNDETINKGSFASAFSPMVKRGLLQRTGGKKNAKYKVTSTGKTFIKPEVEVKVLKKSNILSIKNESFYFIRSLEHSDIFSTHDVVTSLKKLFPDIKERNARTCITRFMKLGVINRTGKNEYKKNLDYDFNALPGHPETVISSYNKNFNPKECTNKYAIAKLQYAKVAKYLEGDVLVFSGPNVKKHVAATKSITKGVHKLHLIDNDPLVFKHILSKINNLDSNVNLIFSNVMDIRINAQFQDLDFCSSWIGKDEDEDDPSEITSVRIMEQAEKGYPVSALSFTFSKRGMNNIDTVKAINNIIHTLGASIKSFDGVNRSYGRGYEVMKQVKSEGNLKYGKKHIPIFRLKGRIIELDFYTYRDTGHMMTCLIIYK